MNLSLAKKLLFSLLLWSASGFVLADVYSNFFSPSLGNLQEELQTARDAGKKGIFLFFEMEECPFCARMKESIFSQQSVQEQFTAEFLALPIDIEGDTEITDFQGAVMTSKEFAQKIYRVRATPVMMFFDLQGNLLYRHTGPSKDAQEFLWLGHYVVSGAHKNQPFSAYRKQQRQQFSQ